jgi:redox-sensitive bicupin YhaK (pirin superfamily)
MHIRKAEPARGGHGVTGRIEQEGHAVITTRPADRRGCTRLDWLDSRHTFSFGDYYDPGQMGFGPLRVVNDDRVAPGAGFPTHGHRDMEILTYVLDGALEHRDSLGTGSVIRRGDLQRMTAGTGIRHSEFNPSPSEPVHFLQIWLLPERAGLLPGYEQRNFPDGEKRNRLRLVAARDGRKGALTIHQDADVYAALLDAGQAVNHRLRDGRGAWVQVAAGAVTLNGRPLAAGDGAAVTGEPSVELAGTEPAEVLLFDLNPGEELP